MTIDDFSKYQIDWLTSHNDIEFNKEEEDLIIRFLKDTAELYQKENECDDCISREQTLKAFAEKCGGECACCEYNGSGYDNAENCKLIKSIPSVTPQKPRGKWIDDNCSICGYGVKPWNNTPYCPNCGADMRESQVRDRK